VRGQFPGDAEHGSVTTDDDRQVGRLADLLEIGPGQAAQAERVGDPGLEQHAQATLAEEGTDLAQGLGRAVGLLLAEQRDGLERWGHSIISPQIPGRPAADGLGREAVAAGAKNLTDQLLSGVVSQKGYTEFLRAYEETIAPFNGWLARNTFMLSARVAPDWVELVERLGEDKDTLDEAVHLWSVAVMAVLERMRVMSEVHDLEDMRKTI
jgi:hypothetical protein